MSKVKYLQNEMIGKALEKLQLIFFGIKLVNVMMNMKHT
mgnify:CR=1 FL=1